VNCRMRQAKELLNQLRETLVHFPVEVLIGKSFVKVRHRGVEKVIICLVCVCDCDGERQRRAEEDKKFKGK